MMEVQELFSWKNKDLLYKKSSRCTEKPDIQASRSFGLEYQMFFTPAGQKTSLKIPATIK